MCSHHPYVHLPVYQSQVPADLHKFFMLTCNETQDLSVKIDNSQSQSQVCETVIYYVPVKIDNFSLHSV